MTLPIHVALASQSAQVTMGDLTTCAAAVGKQVSRDFGPIWGVNATVSAFPDLNHVPADYWPVIVRDDIQAPGAAGYHDDQNNRPYALVQAGPGWQLTVSHETLEALADPSGNRMVAGQSPKPGQGRVTFLVEVADPCEGVQCAYQINGVTVSDFLTPHYYDPTAGACVRYDFTGKLPGPRTLVQDGYLSWLDPTTNHWWQATWFDGSAPQYRDLGIATAAGTSLREWVDRRTNELSLPRVRAEGRVELERMAVDAAAADVARAQQLTEEIQRLVKEGT